VGEADDAGVAQQQRRSQPAAGRQVVGELPLIGITLVMTFAIPSVVTS
jgi:hypothetical protein